MIQIDRGVPAHGGKLDYLVNAAFNCPMLADADSIAALDAFNRM